MIPYAVPKMKVWMSYANNLAVIAFIGELYIDLVPVECTCK